MANKRLKKKKQASDRTTAVCTKAVVKEAKEAVKEETAVTEEAVKEEAAVTEETVKEEIVVTEEAVKEEIAAAEETVKEETAVTEEAVKEEAAAAEETAKEEAAEAEETVKEEITAAEETEGDMDDMNFYVQWKEKEYSQADIARKIREQWAAKGHTPESLKDLRVYLKPEENKAYFVINETENGFVEL